jgi:hypothetical protein
MTSTPLTASRSRYQAPAHLSWRFEFDEVNDLERDGLARLVGCGGRTRERQQLGLRGSGVDTWSESSEDLHGLARDRGILSLQRRPQRRVDGKPESWRHDADDGVRHAVESHGAAEDRGVGSEAPDP